MQVLKKQGKPLNQLKSIHTEHFTKLNNKHQLETELIEDLRSFCKQHAQIEKEYGQALLKLANTYLSKKEVMQLGTLDDNARRSEGKSIWYVWKCLLEQTQGISYARLSAADTQQRLSDQLKPLKLQRIAANKRVLEQLKSLQGELAASLQEMVKAHKVYAEEEKQTHEIRTKSKDADEKVKRRSTNIFNSMAQLQKNSAKLSSRREACETRSTAARNEYLFQLAAVNAHLDHYFTVDLTDSAKVLDGDLFEKIQEVFTSISKHELECCGLTQEHFSRVMCDATQISREHAWKSFIEENISFAEKIQYQFEPMEGDPIHLLCPPSPKDDSLMCVARKLVKRLVQREHQIRDYQLEMRTIQAGRATPQLNQNDESSHAPTGNSDDMLAYSSEYVEHKVEELQLAIKREEIEKIKVEGCINLLKQSGIDVSDLLAEAYAAASASAEMEAENETSYDEGASDPTNYKTQSNRSSYHSSWSALHNPGDTNPEGDAAEGSSPSLNNGHIDSLSNWSSETSTDGDAEPSTTAVVLYEFQATHPDEIDIVIDESLVVLDQNVGEGWIKVRSLSDGREGLVPSAFVYITSETTAEAEAAPQDETDMTSDENYPPQEIEASESSYNPDGRAPASNTNSYGLVRALYDFGADNKDEVSFSAGAVIQLLCCESSPGVDDGWWEGQLLSSSGILEDATCSTNTQFPRGFFPSMLVEFLNETEAELWRDKYGHLSDLSTFTNGKDQGEEPDIPDINNDTVSENEDVTIKEDVEHNDDQVEDTQSEETSTESKEHEASMIKMDESTDTLLNESESKDDESAVTETNTEESINVDQATEEESLT